MPNDGVCQFWQCACLQIASEQQVQDGHEVRLARTKRAVQVGGLALARVYGLLDEPQGLVERASQLRRHDIVLERRVGLVDAFGQLENEVALMDALWYLDQFLDQGHGVRPLKTFLGAGAWWTSLLRQPLPRRKIQLLPPLHSSLGRGS